MLVILFSSSSFFWIIWFFIWGFTFCFYVLRLIRFLWDDRKMTYQRITGLCWGSFLACWFSGKDVTVVPSLSKVFGRWMCAMLSFSTGARRKCVSEKSKSGWWPTLIGMSKWSNHSPLNWNELRRNDKQLRDLIFQYVKGFLQSPSVNYCPSQSEACKIW